MKNDKQKKIPKCHFTEMEFVSADDYPNGQVLFWSCKHCGYTKDVDFSIFSEDTETEIKPKDPDTSRSIRG